MNVQSDLYKESDNIYLNVTFQPTYSSNKPYLLEYSVNKDTPILDKMSNYYVSVIRFDIPLSQIPTTIMPIVPNQPNPNLSSLIIGISYNGVDYPQNLNYTPQGNSTPYSEVIPVQNQPTQVITPYYYIYSYNWLMNMINNALTISYIASGLLALFPTVDPPYFTYNAESQLISLIVPKFFVTLTAPALAIPRICINYNFFQYLDGFSWILRGLNTVNGFDFELSPANIKDIDGYALYGTAPTNPPSYFELQQSNILLQYWNPIKKILLTSDSIPITKEYVQGTSNTSGLSPSMPIITDFTPIVERAGDGRSIAYYLPSAEYRKVNLQSDMSLSKISIRVYWEDVYGNINPMYIGSYQQANIKMVFLHKSMYKTNVEIDRNTLRIK